jgi:hypothetical protein
MMMHNGRDPSQLAVPGNSSNSRKAEHNATGLKESNRNNRKVRGVFQLEGGPAEMTGESTVTEKGRHQKE